MLQYHQVKRRYFLCFSFIFTLIQVLIFFSVSPGKNLGIKELSAAHADGEWYKSILLRGYVSTIPPTPQSKSTSNVGFFPLYPNWGRLIYILTPLSPERSLIWAARLSTFLFWYYFLVFLNLCRIPFLLTLLAAGTIISHPTSYYMISAYSESTHLALLMGFVYWSQKKDKGSQILSILHGVGANATRAGGILLSLAPFLKLNKLTPSSWLQAFFLSFILSLGAIGFFTYCQIKFGVWDLYFQTERIGWGQEPNFFALLYPSTYSIFIPKWGNAYELGLFSITLSAFLLICLWVSELASTQKDAWKIRVYLTGIAFSILFISASGSYRLRFVSMVRFHLVIWVFLITALTHRFYEFYRNRNRKQRPYWVAAYAFISFCVIVYLFPQMIQLASNFAHDLWVG